MHCRPRWVRPRQQKGALVISFKLSTTFNKNAMVVGSEALVRSRRACLAHGEGLLHLLLVQEPRHVPAPTHNPTNPPTPRVPTPPTGGGLGGFLGFARPCSCAGGAPCMAKQAPATLGTHHPVQHHTMGAWCDVPALPDLAKVRVCELLEGRPPLPERKLAPRQRRPGTVPPSKPSEPRLALLASGFDGRVRACATFTTRTRTCTCTRTPRAGLRACGEVHATRGPRAIKRAVGSVCAGCIQCRVVAWQAW